MKVLGVDVPPAVAEKEPVLNVPAIDMTEQADTAAADVGSADVAKPARRQRAAKQKPRRAKEATKADTPKQTRDGSVGRETFAAVEALVKDGSSKTDAFKAVAKNTNRSANTVATTYYRVARQGAVKLRGGQGKATTAPRSKTASARRSGARSNAGNTARITHDAQQVRDIDRVATSLMQSVNALADIVNAQSVELAELRQRLDGVRSILG